MPYVLPVCRYLDEATGKEKRNDDEPDDVVGVGLERLLEGEGLGNHCERESTERPCPDRKRARHQAGHRREENGQELPALSSEQTVGPAKLLSFRTDILIFYIVFGSRFGSPL